MHPSKTLEVVLINRRKGEFWSIEQGFDAVKSHLPMDCVASWLNVPVAGARLRALCANLKFARHLRADVFHVTGDIHYLVMGLRKAPVVLTINDIRVVEESQGIRRFLLWLGWIWLPVLMADRVTVISESTRERLCRFLPFLKSRRERIVVIPYPILPCFKPVAKSGNQELPVALHVGTTSNKNLERVIEAVRGLRLNLWVLGRLNASQLSRLEESGVVYENFFDLKQEEVADLYVRCDFVVFPSLYEGFGLPILEGQAVGRPVITSDIAPMNGVAGGGALKVDPFDVTSIRSGIERIMTDAGLRDALVREGFLNVANYSAESVAAQYAELYREILNES